MDIIGLATPEVADEIRRLREENARLTRERDEARAKLEKVVEALEVDALFVDCEFCRRAIAAVKGE